MRIEQAVRSINTMPDRWVRLERVRRLPGGLDLSFGIYRGRRGRRFGAWEVTCLKVHEATITAWDGGGLRLYSSSHPAAREFVAPQVELRWEGTMDEISVIGALSKAHATAVDDWIPFGSHASIRPLPKNKFALRGPDFLMRAYAKALRTLGCQPRLILRRGRRTAIRPKVLHFGNSFVVANAFIAKECDQEVRGLPAAQLGTGGKRRRSAASSC